MDIKKLILEKLEEINLFREDIHKHPELGYEEYNTTNKIMNILKENHVECYKFSKFTGCYSKIFSNENNKTIAIRVDIDALPIKENTNLTYKSKEDGLMHACGHDIHTAIGVGLSILLNQLKDKLKNNVIILFQPAEECNPTGGAKMIIEESIIRKFNIEEIYGCHVWPQYKVGQIGVKSGTMMGSSDKFSIVIKGKKSHAAQPHNGIDAISIAVELVNGVEGKLRREIDPFEPYVLSIGSFNSEGRYNVICDKVVIEGTIRTVSNTTREFIHSRMNVICERIASAYNGEIILNIENGYKVVKNDEFLVAKFINQLNNYKSKDEIITDLAPTLIGEDFSFYCEDAKTLYFFLGCECEYPLHSDKFCPKDGTIESGLEVFLSYILNQ